MAVPRLQIDFNQFEYAIAAADHGSFRRAAEALSIKQSTISRSVRMLEHTLGVPIFQRSRHGVRATSAGRQFLRVARSIVEQLDSLAAMTRASGQGQAGRLNIGFCTSLAAGNLRALILDFRNRFPQVELGTAERSKARLVTALRNGVVDVQIVPGETLLLDCKNVQLWSERVFVALPNEHRLAEQSVIYWTDLRDETLLLGKHDPDLGLENVLNAKLLAESNRPKIERHDVGRSAIKNLIRMGLGLCLVLESDTGEDLKGLTYRELRDGTGPSRIGFSAAWREDNENPALMTFLRLISERYPLSF